MQFQTGKGRGTQSVQWEFLYFYPAQLILSPKASIEVGGDNSKGKQQAVYGLRRKGNPT